MSIYCANKVRGGVSNQLQGIQDEGYIFWQCQDIPGERGQVRSTSKRQAQKYKLNSTMNLQHITNNMLKSMYVFIALKRLM